VDGRRYLEQLVADQLTRHAPDPRWVRGVGAGLVAAGVLEQPDMDRILSGFQTELENSGRLKRFRAGGSASSGIATARAVREEPEPATAHRSPELRSVISLAGQTLTFGGRTAHLVCLEVWSTVLSLSLAYLDAEHGAFGHRYYADSQWRGWDDVGTQYRGGGGSGAGGGRVHQFRHTFIPGPPEGAREITLAVEHPDGGASVTIPLA
jgi:hypothetical protein